MRFIRTIVTVVALNVFVLVSALFVFVWVWLVPVVFVALTAWLIRNGLKNIPAQPPHKAILMFFGRRLKIVLGEGWNFFPLYPFVFSFALVKVEKVNYDLEPQQVRTPDRAVISISASVTWTPGVEDRPESYIAYLNSGGEEGVRKIIHDVIEDRTKTWAGSNKEGPSTWMEAQAMKDDAHEVLVKSLVGDDLTPIPAKFQKVPTSTWMRFLDDPKSEPTEYDANPQNHWAIKNKETGEWNWDDLQRVYDGFSDDDRQDLALFIKMRRLEIKRIRQGKGSFRDESLGITIVRFTVNEVKVEGKVAEAAELEEKERREREADKMEIENVSERIKKLRTDHPDMPLEEAIMMVQTERGKISESVIRVIGAKTGLGQDAIVAFGLQKLPGAPAASASGQGNQGQQGGGQKKKKKKDPGEMTDKDANAYLDGFLRGEDEDEEDEDEETK